MAKQFLDNSGQIERKFRDYRSKKIYRQNVIGTNQFGPGEEPFKSISVQNKHFFVS